MPAPLQSPAQQEPWLLRENRMPGVLQSEIHNAGVPQPEHKLPTSLQAEIQHAGGHQEQKDWNQAGEHVNSVNTQLTDVDPEAKIRQADANYELHKQQAINPELPIVERLKFGAIAATDVIQGTLYRAASELQNPIQKWVDTPTDHHVKAREADANYEIQKHQATDPNAPITERLLSSAQAAGLIVAAEYHRVAEHLKTDLESTGPTLNDQVQAKSHEVSEHAKVQEADASYELHKSQATNPNLPATDRLTAGAKLVEDAVACGVHRVAEAYYKM